MSELEGLTYTCLDNCAMCCLCQPELSKEELAGFRAGGLEDGLTRDHIDGRRTKEPTAIKLQKGRGACYFLKDRRCTIYDMRTKYCRQFPVHIHAMGRIQVISNLSCRGIGKGDNSLLEFGKQILAGVPEETLENELAKAGELLAEIEARCKNAGVFQDKERLRSVAGRCRHLIKSDNGIGRLLGFADTEPYIGNMPEDQLIKIIGSTPVPQDLDVIANLDNYEQFELENIGWLPIYVDENMVWNLIQSKNEKIRWLKLEEGGELKVLREFGRNDIGLLPLDDDALEVFANYANIINSRDHFLGYVYHICAGEGFRNDMMTVYLGALATALLDLWWRASLIGRVNERTEINEWLAKEGIIAFDMGSQDPAIGTFF